MFGAQAMAMALTAGAWASSARGGGGNTSSGTDPDSRKGNFDDKQNDNRGSMATFTIAKSGLMHEATLSGQKFKTGRSKSGQWSETSRPPAAFFCGANPPSSDLDQSSTTEKWIST